MNKQWLLKCIKKWLLKVCLISLKKKNILKKLYKNGKKK